MIELVHQDPHLIVVNKPPGLLCVPGLSTPENLHDRVLQEYPNARVVHRLDMATSGLVIFALNYECQRELGKLFEKRKVFKSYTAVINGVLKSHHGEIHSALICDWEKRPKQKLDWVNGKPASTSFSRISVNTNNNTSRVKLTPTTGRTHQLRLHMLQIGHPIVGDNFYSKEGGFNVIEDRMKLHATALKFDHPIEKKIITIHKESDF